MGKKEIELNEIEFLWIMARFLFIFSTISLIGAVLELGELEKEVIIKRRQNLIHSKSNTSSTFS